MTHSAATVETFFAQYRERNYQKGRLLASAGENPTGVFYLTSGHVTQYDITPSGNVVVVNVFKPGAFFPMSWAINKQANQYFFEAASDVAVRVAPAEEVVQFVRTHPDVLFDLLTRVYKGVDGVLRRVVHLMGGTAKSRLIFEIINAAGRFGESQPDGSILLSLTEGDLAQRTGLARETVNRIIQQLKTAKIITVTPGGLVIHHLSALDRALGDTV